MSDQEVTLGLNARIVKPLDLPLSRLSQMLPRLGAGQGVGPTLVVTATAMLARMMLRTVRPSCTIERRHLRSFLNSVTSPASKAIAAPAHASDKDSAKPGLYRSCLQPLPRVACQELAVYASPSVGNGLQFAHMKLRTKFTMI